MIFDLIYLSAIVVLAIFIIFPDLRLEITDVNFMSRIKKVIKGMFRIKSMTRSSITK